MYSPKISEELVPVLYRLAKEQKKPMTRLVDGIIRAAIADNIAQDVGADCSIKPSGAKDRRMAVA